MNSAVAMAALVASGISATFAWRSYNLKSESLGFTVRPTYECPLEFRNGTLALCWHVTITNQSETRISIVRYQAFDVSKGPAIHRSGFSTIQGIRGEPIFPPIVLEGGDARVYLMRVPFDVPPAVAALAETLPQDASLHQLQSLTLKSGVDVIGNKVDVKYFDEQKRQASVSWIYGLQVVIGEIKFFTGRNNIFSARMSFPPILRAE